jgi:hypothetical protein
MFLVVILFSLLMVSCAPIDSVDPFPADVTPEASMNTPTINQPAVPHPTMTPEPSQDPTEVITPTQEITPTPSPIIAVPTMEQPTESAPTRVVNPTPELDTRSGGAIIVDHTAVELFEQIPEEYLESARNINMLFANRSVGKNIDDALNCLMSEAWHLSRAYCRNDYYDTSSVQWLSRTYTQEDYLNGVVPSTILFEPDPVLYDRSKWAFDIAEGEWEDTIQMFVEDLVPDYVNEKDVLSFQFNYFNIRQGSNIADPETGFFVDLPHQDYYPNRLRWDIGSIEELEEMYPDKIFFYWTTSLARGIGSEEGEVFNNQLREYARANDKVLFDVAAILSHDPEGKPCYDNRDGVEYCNNNRCENHPDDGKNYPAICQAYTTETDGGHLGSVSGGGLRVAKAFWVLMAKIAGWDG